MTDQTYLSNSIMAYVGSDADVVGVSGVTVLPDWDGDKVYFLQTATLIGPGIRQFDIDPGGDETLQRSAASIGVAQIAASSGGAASISSDGSKLYFTSEAANSVRLAQVRASDLTLLAQFGTASSSLADSTSSRILAVDKQVYIGASLLTGTLLTTAELCVVDSGFGSNLRLGAMDESSTAGILLGPGSGNNGYAIALPYGNGTVSGDHTQAFGLYHVGLGSFTKVGTVGPTAIDATWTTVFAVRGIAYDASDGNLLIGVTTNDVGPTNTNYIVKLNATTAAVMWTRAVNSMTPYSWSFTWSRIANGKFHYLGGSSLVYHITTSSGAVTTETFTGLSISGPQVSDDVTNSIILYGSFSAGGSPPDYLGTYMDTGGHHNVSSVWLRVWFATAGGGGGGGTGGSQGGLAFTTQRAWGFTLDGHSFYVLDLNAEGTWVFDLTTNEVYRWYTEGYSGRWDAIAGAMWGLRIVAGDITSTTVWEIIGTVTSDNDATLQIAHVATGGIQTRSRKFHSVNAFRVADSNGQLGDTGGATIQLRWSDDNGKSWSDYESVDMVQADYSGEVAFLSLGAFSAPGRIFELSDVGGPVRIDGIDGEIDGLDADNGQT